MDTEEVEQQLSLLKRITKMTGALHEAQVLQLKLWGLVAFPEAKRRPEFTWDPTDRYVEFRVSYGFWSKLFPRKDRLLRYRALEVAVKQLLGDEWQVIVKANGTVVHA